MLDEVCEILPAYGSTKNRARPLHLGVLELDTKNAMLVSLGIVVFLG